MVGMVSVVMMSIEREVENSRDGRVRPVLMSGSGC